jgi:hypothetical protein
MSTNIPGIGNETSLDAQIDAINAFEAAHPDLVSTNPALADKLQDKLSTINDKFMAILQAKYPNTFQYADFPQAQAALNSLTGEINTLTNTTIFADQNLVTQEWGTTSAFGTISNQLWNVDVAKLARDDDSGVYVNEVGIVFTNAGYTSGSPPPTAAQVQAEISGLSAIDTSGASANIQNEISDMIKQLQNGLPALQQLESDQSLLTTLQGQLPAAQTALANATTFYLGLTSLEKDITQDIAQNLFPGVTFPS